MITTSHQLARDLLAGPDLPIHHFDPSRAGYDEEIDTSLSSVSIELHRADLVDPLSDKTTPGDPCLLICGADHDHYEMSDAELALQLARLDDKGVLTS